MHDLSRIEPLFLKENYLVGLGLPKGFVFFRVQKRESYPYNYHEIDGATANQLIADEWANEAKANIGTLNRSIDNLFQISNNALHLYQVFAGLRPSVLRMYPSAPSGTIQHRLDAAARIDKDFFGYTDGFMSPTEYPAPASEMWIPYKFEVGFAWYNPSNDTIFPAVTWYINRYLTSLIKDPDLISRILSRHVECRFATVGGITAYDYEAKDQWGINEVKLGDSRAQIESSLTGKRED